MKPTIAIIGAGPRGFFALERLLAHAAASPHAALTVHVFHDGPYPGAGNNYRPDQPAYLLLNFPVSHVRAWPAASPRPLTHPSPSLLDWLRSEYTDQCWTPASYVARATVGRYLTDAFQQTIAHAPPGVTVVCHHASATDAMPCEEGFLVHGRSAEDSVAVRADHVLLATGHTPAQPSKQPSQDEDFAASHPATGFVARPFPVAAWLDHVPAGATVALRGTGLTCIDLCLALTEGRGGSFSGDALQGPLTYHASGHEPASLLPFSHSGLPPLPKPVGPWPARGRFRPVVLSLSALHAARNQQPGGQLDFQLHVLPLLEREMAHAYYQAQLPPSAWPALRSAAASTIDLAAAAASLGADPHRRFNLSRLLDPRQPDAFTSSQAYHNAVTRRWLGGCAEARAGLTSPVLAAVDTWNQLFPLMQATVQFGGLTPASHRAFDTHYKPALARLTFGPPVINAAKMAALAQRGLVDYGVAAAATVSHTPEGAFCIASRNIHGSHRTASWLVEAHMPPASVSSDASPLLRALRNRGLIRDYVNGRGTPEAFRAGGIDLVPGLGVVIGADGAPVPGLYATGFMMEGASLGNDSLFRETNDYTNAWAAHVVATLALT